MHYVIASKLKKIKTFGDSMIPLLQNGDVIYLSRVNSKFLKTNDIITFRQKGVFLTHRIIYKTPSYVITKGDANTKADGKIFPKQVVGKVYQVKRQNTLFSPNDLYLIQSSLYFQEITEINDIFKRNGINFLFLKGLPISLHYFKIHPQKIYADCDILIENNKKSVNTVETLLRKLGFTLEDLSYYKKAQLFLTKTFQQKTYYKKVNDILIVIEIHYRIPIFTHKISLPKYFTFSSQEEKLATEFLQTKKNIQVNNFSFPILDENYFIFYLLLHFYSHKWTGSYRLEQIHNIVSSKKNIIRLEYIIETAKKRKVLNFIIPGLYLLKIFYKNKTLYNYANKKYKNNLTYSLRLYKFLYGKETFFGEGSFFTARERIKRAVIMFLLIDEPGYKKFLVLCSPRLQIHLLYFLFLLIQSRVKKIMSSINFFYNFKFNQFF